MIQARLTEIKREEALYYLGYKGPAPTEELSRQLNESMQLVMETARPKIYYKICDLGLDGRFLGTTFRPEGDNIREMLKDCRRGILLAATLGISIDQLSGRIQIQDMAKALIFDSCASVAIENVCDNFCADMAAELEKQQPFQYLTDRFSPGYGDFPFEQQKLLCTVLDTSRKIGVGLTDSGLMIPQKSVNAVVGIADRPQSRRFRGCGHCNMFYSCTYRKDNHYCGKK